MSRISGKHGGWEKNIYIQRNATSLLSKSRKIHLKIEKNYYFLKDKTKTERYKEITKWKEEEMRKYMSDNPNALIKDKAKKWAMFLKVKFGTATVGKLEKMS